MVSSVDLADDARFILLAGADGEPWYRAFGQAIAARGIEGVAYTVGARGDLVDPLGSFADLYGIDPAGAVLIRPDGHVAWRSATQSRSEGRELHDALDRALCLPQ